MFRLSSKADYGLIFLSNLVPRDARDKPKSDSNRPVSVSSIAKKYKIPAKFLSQIALDLKKAGIISAKEGVSGGYRLIKKPAQIKLTDVLKVLDGDLVVGRCMEDDHECVCGAGDMFKDMKESMEKVIGKKTVADLVWS
ncbi:MAG TPA: Rrf2 family transcriptional regulator [Patescibacteria group bacterium]